MNIKVMKLPRLYKNHKFAEEVAAGYHKEVPVVFNRDGIYRMGDACWLESDGRAFEYDKDFFDYELSLLNHKSLSDSVLCCLERALSLGIASKSQMELLFYERRARKAYARRLEGFRRRKLLLYIKEAERGNARTKG